MAQSAVAGHFHRRAASLLADPRFSGWMRDVTQAVEEWEFPDGPLARICVSGADTRILPLKREVFVVVFVAVHHVDRTTEINVRRHV